MVIMECIIELKTCPAWEADVDQDDKVFEGHVTVLALEYMSKSDHSNGSKSISTMCEHLRPQQCPWSTHYGLRTT